MYKNIISRAFLGILFLGSVFSARAMQVAQVPSDKMQSGKTDSAFTIGRDIFELMVYNYRELQSLLDTALFATKYKQLPSFVGAQFGKASLSAQEIKDIYKAVTGNSSDALSIVEEKNNPGGFGELRTVFGKEYILAGTEKMRQLFDSPPRKPCDLGNIVIHPSLENLKNASEICAQLNFEIQPEEQAKKQKNTLIFVVAHESGHLKNKHQNVYAKAWLKMLLKNNLTHLIQILSNLLKPLNYLSISTAYSKIHDLIPTLKGRIYREYCLTHQGTEFEADAETLRAVAFNPIKLQINGKTEEFSLDDMLEGALYFFECYEESRNRYIATDLKVPVDEITDDELDDLRHKYFNDYSSTHPSPSRRICFLKSEYRHLKRIQKLTKARHDAFIKAPHDALVKTIDEFKKRQALNAIFLLLIFDQKRLASLLSEQKNSESAVAALNAKIKQLGEKNKNLTLEGMYEHCKQEFHKNLRKQRLSGR